jgi:hypothetical protein
MADYSPAPGAAPMCPMPPANAPGATTINLADEELDMPEAKIDDPAQVALFLLDMLEAPGRNHGQSVIDVLRMCQLHGTSFARIGRFMDVLPLERAFSAPAYKEQVHGR